MEVVTVPLPFCHALVSGQAVLQIGLWCDVTAKRIGEVTVT